MDGRREAHMDVLVAVFGQPFSHGSTPQTRIPEAGTTRAKTQVAPNSQSKTEPRRKSWAVAAVARPRGRQTKPGPELVGYPAGRSGRHPTAVRCRTGQWSRLRVSWRWPVPGTPGFSRRVLCRFCAVFLRPQYASPCRPGPGP